MITVILREYLTISLKVWLETSWFIKSLAKGSDWNDPTELVDIEEQLRRRPFGATDRSVLCSWTSARPMSEPTNPYHRSPYAITFQGES